MSRLDDWAEIEKLLARRDDLVTTTLERHEKAIERIRDDCDNKYQTSIEKIRVNCDRRREKADEKFAPKDGRITDRIVTGVIAAATAALVTWVTRGAS